MRISLAFGCTVAALFLATPSAMAATATGSFNSQIIITAQCKVQSASTLNFGSPGVLDAAVNATSSVSVQCTNGQGYTISLDGGNGTSGTTTTRTMENGSEFVNYAMFKDAARTQNWGNAGGEIMTALTGNGAAQSYTVYGQVPVQTTPTAGTYTDTVTVTVTYP
jgi:spore coat protein U-like protein